MSNSSMRSLMLIALLIAASISLINVSHDTIWINEYGHFCIVSRWLQSYFSGRFLLKVFSLIIVKRFAVLKCVQPLGQHVLFVNIYS